MFILGGTVVIAMDSFIVLSNNEYDSRLQLGWGKWNFVADSYK